MGIFNTFCMRNQSVIMNGKTIKVPSGNMSVMSDKIEGFMII